MAELESRLEPNYLRYRGMRFLREEPDGKVITLWHDANCQECDKLIANGTQKLYTTLSDKEVAMRGALQADTVPPLGKRFTPHQPLLCQECYEASMNPLSSPISRFE